MSARANRFRHVSFLEDAEPPTRGIPSPRERPARRTRPSPVVLDPEAAEFFDGLCSRWGLRAERYRASIFQRRQAASLRALRAASLRDGAKVIMSDGAAAEMALGAVMIGVTSFFRDPKVFLPLRARLRALHESRGPLNVMSVGCSDGSELYTVAMLMAEEGLLRGSRLWGIDCRPSAIARAKEGIYPADAVEAVPADLRSKYFGQAKVPLALCSRVGAVPGVRVVDRLRRVCRWEVADAFAASAQRRRPRTFDVILCRNMAIYLTPESATELWSLLAAQLSPGGLLVVGKAERPAPAARSLLVRVGLCMYQRSSTER